MQILNIVSFFLIIIGFAIHFDITPKNYVKDLGELIKKHTGNDKTSLKERIEKAKAKKKDNFLKRLIAETKEMMLNNGTIGSFNKIVEISIVLSIVGAVIALLVDNIYLVPVLAILLALIPFYYVRIQSIIYKQEINKELEGALSNITSSYLRSNTTFLDAVSDNIDSIKYPLKNIFKRYEFTCKHINPNTKENLKQLKNTINNSIFKEWVDGVIAAEDNYNLKATLPNITNKFADVRIINNELSTKLYAPLKDYTYTVILTILTIPIFYLFNKSAVVDYLNLTLGKIEIAVVFVVIIVVSIKVMNETHNIEYES